MLSSYSYSSLDTYRVCPRKFKFNYVEKVSTVPKITADTYLGTAVHRVLKDLYALGADGILMSKEDAVKRYIGQWEKLNRKLISVTSEYYTVDDYIRIGQEMLVRHYDRYQPFNQGTLLGAEMHIAFQLAGTPFKFKSYIDRLWKREDGTVEICDYKTGQSLTQPGDPRFFYQMGLYQLAVQANFPDTGDVELAQYFLRKDEIVRRRLTPDELDQLAEELRLAIVDTMRAEKTDDFPAKEGNHCFYCNFQEICPAKIHRRIMDKEEVAGRAGELSGEELKQLADEYLQMYLDAKDLKLKLDGLKEKLVEIARENDISRLDGDLGRINMSLARKDEFVSKSRDEDAFVKLSALSRDLNLEEYFTLDTRSLMKEVYLKKRLPEEQLKLLEEFVVEVERSRVTARINTESDRETD